MFAFLETVLIFTWLVSAISVGIIMANRGSNGFGGFIVGLIFGVFAIPIAMTTRRLPRWDEARCDACKEIIRKEALACPYCTRTVAEAKRLRQEAETPPADA